MKKRGTIKPTDNVPIEVPIDAVNYIVSRYLGRKSTGNLPMVVGIPSDAVESVLGLFLEWAAANNYVKDGVLTLGGTPIG